MLSAESSSLGVGWGAYNSLL